MQSWNEVELSGDPYPMQSFGSHSVSDAASHTSIWYAGASFVMYAVRSLSVEVPYGHGATAPNIPGSRKEIHESEMIHLAFTGSAWYDVVTSLIRKNIFAQEVGSEKPPVTVEVSKTPRPPLTFVQFAGIKSVSGLIMAIGLS
jgi:hypothetical protein